MDERRKSKRYPIAYPVERRHGYDIRTLTLVDVSQGGIAFTDSEKMEKNEKVEIRLFLKNRSFNLNAIVVHARQLRENIYNIGARFLNLPKEFAATFEKEVSHITQLHRESNLYRHKDLSFKKASQEYLGSDTGD